MTYCLLPSRRVVPVLVCALLGTFPGSSNALSLGSIRRAALCTALTMSEGECIRAPEHFCCKATNEVVEAARTGDVAFEAQKVQKHANTKRPKSANPGRRKKRKKPQPGAEFAGGQRRGGTAAETELSAKQNASASDSSPNRRQSSPAPRERHPERYDLSVCVSLKVPCRFVRDHQCCRFEMPLSMAARGRAMDVKENQNWLVDSPLSQQEWRSRGRSLVEEENLDFRPVHEDILTDVRYTHARQEERVAAPEYHFSTDPGVLNTIVGLCWRMASVRCRSQGAQDAHPCCQLLSKPRPREPAETRLTKWLVSNDPAWSNGRPESEKKVH